MKKRKATQTVSFILAALLLGLHLLTAPSASLQAQAAPVTFPDGTVFDPEFYAETYPDVKAAFGTDPSQLWLHYYTFGRAEGRLAVAPGATQKMPAAAQKAQASAATPAAAPASLAFDPGFYANTYADLKAAFGNDAAKLWLHYRMFGEKEGRLAAKGAVPGVTKITAPAGVKELAVPNAGTGKAAAPAAPVIKSNGRRVAFIGDSITTFGGQLPAGYEAFYPQKGLENLGDTWWYRVCAGTGLQTVINASWSGSRLVGDRNDTTGIVGSAPGRINAVVAQAPDVVFIMMGTNDYGAGINLLIFRERYLDLVNRLRGALPNATIILCTCIPQFFTTKNAQDATMGDYNAEIRRIAGETGCYLIDTYGCGLQSSQMIDAFHPNAEGAALIANYVLAHMPRIR